MKALFISLLVVALLLTVYSTARAVTYELTLKGCIEHKFPHAIVTYDFGRYCYTTYNAAEIIGPLDEIIKLDAQSSGPGF